MKVCKIVALLACFSMLTGCAAITYETYSKPSIEGVKPTRIFYEDGYLFEYEGIDFYASISNRHTAGLVVFPLPFPFKEGPNKDWTTSDVSVLLRPNRQGGTFNPSHMIWRDSQGLEHHPTLLHRGPDNCETVRLYLREVIDRPLPVEPIDLPANESTCFDVTFAIVPPNPEETFVIELSELVFDGKAFPLPAVRFEKSGYMNTIAIP